MSRSRSRSRSRSPLEERLWREAERAATELAGLRENRTEDIFTRSCYIGPEDLVVTNFLRSRPLAAFNPGAFEREGDLFIFPRLVFDYYHYVSSIGVMAIGLEEVVQGGIVKPLEVEIILWPEELWEFGRGCEDPRVSLLDDRLYMLYTGSRRHQDPARSGRQEQGQDQGLVEGSVQGLAEFSPSPPFELRRRGRFSILGGGDEIIPSNKDSALIEVGEGRASLLTRPDFGGIALCWSAQAQLEALTMAEETLKPVLAFEEWEYKVGWSTNTVKLSEGEYLVGWHGVLKEDLSYRNGLAIVDGEGKLLAVSDYLLAPRGLTEIYGDRPLVIFGNGLVRYEDSLIWVGGIGDYGIGIFTVDLKRALAELKEVA